LNFSATEAAALRFATRPAPCSLSSEAWTAACSSSFQMLGLFFPISSWPSRRFWFTVRVPADRLYPKAMPMARKKPSFIVAGTEGRHGCGA